MALIPQEILQDRRAELRERNKSLDRSEEKFATNLPGVLLVKLGFAAAFCAGVVVDTIKAGIESNSNGPRPSV
jgi:hypothetical protein